MRRSHTRQIMYRRNSMKLKFETYVEGGRSADILKGESQLIALQPKQSKLLLAAWFGREVRKNMKKSQNVAVSEDVMECPFQSCSCCLCFFHHHHYFSLLHLIFSLFFFNFPLYKCENWFVRIIGVLSWGSRSGYADMLSLMHTFSVFGPVNEKEKIEFCLEVEEEGKGVLFLSWEEGRCTIGEEG